MAAREESATRLFAGLVLGVSLSFLLAAVVAVVASRLGGGMGWDQLANALGGFAIGAFSGAILSTWLARTIEIRLLRRLALLAFTAAALLVAFVVWRVITSQ